jgi:DNA-binding transcriptional ArsR family regulator
MEGGLGSTGINATADCTITLTRKRKAGEGFLRAVGRDIEEVHWAMRWDKDICTWSMDGDAPEEKDMPKSWQTVLDILEKAAPQAMKTGEVAKALGKSETNVCGLLNRLKSVGLVTKPEYGRWSTARFTPLLPLRENESVNVNGMKNEEELEIW